MRKQFHHHKMRLSTSPSSRFLYHFIEDVERLERYQPGGYHPIQIGNRFHDRYRIVHKLGYGTFSTIWLAKDEEFSKYVAIKVCTADAIHHEVDTLSHLQDAALQKESAGRSLIPAILSNESAFKAPTERTLVSSLPRHGAVSLIPSRHLFALFSSSTLLDLSQPSSPSPSPRCMSTVWCMEVGSWAPTQPFHDVQVLTTVS
jgi:hypothetical protein